MVIVPHVITLQSENRQPNSENCPEVFFQAIRKVIKNIEGPQIAKMSEGPSWSLVARHLGQDEDNRGKPVHDQGPVNIIDWRSGAQSITDPLA